MNFIRNYIGRKLNQYYLTRGKMIAEFAKMNVKEDIDGLTFIKKIKGETEMLLKDSEAFTIYKLVRKTEKIQGDIAEVGVYKGASAKLIRSATEKTIHLFDTFEGLPQSTAKDKEQKFKEGEMSFSLEDVKKYLKDYHDILFYKGIFPSTSSPVEQKKFSFVHLDVDLYQSTVDCLKFFYPRMNLGGVIISHDYQNLIGVKRAFDEFFADKPEIILEPAGTSQALVIKV